MIFAATIVFRIKQLTCLFIKALAGIDQLNMLDMYLMALAFILFRRCFDVFLQ